MVCVIYIYFKNILLITSNYIIVQVFTCVHKTLKSQKLTSAANIRCIKKEYIIIGKIYYWIQSLYHKNILNTFALLIIYQP
jgi:hypothetical protein